MAAMMPRAKKIYLCRHGQDEDNANGLLNGHRDEPLSPLGQQQAATVASKIQEDHSDIDVVLCSPLLRAKNTAEAIAARLGKDVSVHPDLIERDFGVLTGKPLTAIPEHATETLQTEKVLYFLKAEGAEDFEALLQRAERVLQHVHEQYPDQTVLLVCHGDIGKMLLAAHRGLTWEASLRAPYIANTEVLVL